MRQTIPKFKVPAWEYFDDLILGGYDELDIKHPTDELWLHNQVRLLCKKASSTQFTVLLEKLALRVSDPVTRGQLAKKSYMLRVGYLQSFKEYSDRALMLLAEREIEFDQWEGIYILGCFGKDKALTYLQQRLASEQNALLAQTIKRAIEKIEINKKRREKERGF